MIQNFNEHRAAFEQLKEMLQADGHLRRVANWGVDTTKPFFLGYPSEKNFPIDRFNQYLALLKQVNGKMAGRDEGEYPNPWIMVWVWGWAGAGDIKHIGICWMDQAPTIKLLLLMITQAKEQTGRLPISILTRTGIFGRIGKFISHDNFLPNNFHREPREIREWNFFRVVRVVRGCNSRLKQFPSDISACVEKCELNPQPMFSIVKK